MTQNESLVRYLKKHPRGITTFEAVTKLGICRLSERCRELKASGVPLGKYRDPKKRSDGTKANVMRYYLA